MTTTEIQAPDLVAASQPALVDLFLTLDAPDMSEMVGEFDGTPLQQPSFIRNSIAVFKVRNRLHHWQSKGFRQIDAETGRGYNIYRRAISGQRLQRDPMTTGITNSHIDGKPAFQLDYRPFETVNGFVNLVDDVRRVRPGLYLGFGMFGFTDRQRSVLQPFMLEATSRPYIADIGTLRSEQRHGQQDR